MSEKNAMPLSKLPQYPESYWTNTAGFKPQPKLAEDVKVDVAVVGAGIVGVITAYLLVKEGLKVALLDAGKILNGTTGHTTAKITMQHDLFYNDLISTWGEEKARLYYEANREGMKFIRDTASAHSISCGLVNKDAYVYTCDSKSIDKIADEMKTYEKLGIPGELLDSTPLPLPVQSAIVMRNQAQFHPLHFLQALIEDIGQEGGRVYENTTAVDIETGTSPRVVTRDGHTITCNHVVASTHFPFYDGKGLYFSRVHA